MRQYRGWIGLFSVLAFFIIAQQVWKKQHADIILQTPNGIVSIHKDANDVPHIVAKSSDLAAFYALGYIHAKDRFWQMEFQRHVVSGRLSELFGEKTLAQDQYLRSWQFYRVAKDNLQFFNQPALAILDSYTAGVNAYLAKGSLPIAMRLLGDKPTPWTRVDSIAWQKMLAWDLQYTFEDKIKNYLIAKKLGESAVPILMPPYPIDAPTILSTQDLQQAHVPVNVPQTVNFAQNTQALWNVLHKNLALRQQLAMSELPGIGSNSWVVSGRLTNTGKPFLENDPHLNLQAPAVWYLASLQGPHLQVMGATLPGMPVVVIGHNQSIAWGLTNSFVDAQDLYVIQDPKSLVATQETILVKGKPAVPYTIYTSQYGPIISQVTPSGLIAPMVAIRWPALMKNDTTAQSMIEINYAKNWPEFVAALKDFVAPSQNFIYADVMGNIGYYLPGRIPVRIGIDAKYPIFPGKNTPTWSGFIPFDQLPHVENPKAGYIVAANNKIVPDSYPYALTFHWKEPPYRAERILALLRTHQGLLTMQSMQAMQLDTVSQFWLDLKPVLVLMHPKDSTSEQALALLQGWSGDMRMDSVPATIYAYWYRELLSMQPAFIQAVSYRQEALFIVQQLKNNGSYCQIHGAKNCQEFMQNTLQVALQKLIHDQGALPQNWQWGQVHHAVFRYLGLGESKALGFIWNRQISTPGDRYTIDVGVYDEKNFNQIAGSSYRQIIDLSDFQRSVYMQTLGQSGNVLSPFYQNFMQPWRDGRYISLENT